MPSNDIQESWLLRIFLLTPFHSYTACPIKTKSSPALKFGREQLHGFPILPGLKLCSTRRIKGLVLLFCEFSVRTLFNPFPAFAGTGDSEAKIRMCEFA